MISQESQAEVQFWWVNFDTGGYPIWFPSPKVEVFTYSDASGQGWGGFAVQLSDKVAKGSWSCEESGKSSMFREVTAVRHVLESLQMKSGVKMRVIAPITGMQKLFCKWEAATRSCTWRLWRFTSCAENLACA